MSREGVSCVVKRCHIRVSVCFMRVCLVKKWSLEKVGISHVCWVRQCVTAQMRLLSSLEAKMYQQKNPNAQLSHGRCSIFASAM